MDKLYKLRDENKIILISLVIFLITSIIIGMSWISERKFLATREKGLSFYNLAKTCNLYKSPGCEAETWQAVTGKQLLRNHSVYNNYANSRDIYKPGYYKIEVYFKV
jgi:hypothetical protein